jgi:hypothetical protein
MPEPKRHRAAGGVSGSGGDEVEDIADFLVDDDEDGGCADPGMYARVDKERSESAALTGEEEEKIAQSFKDKYLKTRMLHGASDCSVRGEARAGPLEVADGVDMEREDDFGPLVIEAEADTQKSSDSAVGEFLQLLCAMQDDGVTGVQVKPIKSVKAIKCRNIWQSMVAERSASTITEKSFADWTTKIYDLITKEQVMVLREATSAAVCCAGGDAEERTVACWKRVSTRLFERLISDISDDNTTEYKNYAFTESCLAAKSAVYANTFRVLGLLNSLYRAVATMEQQAIAGSGVSLGYLSSSTPSAFALRQPLPIASRECGGRALRASDNPAKRAA